jgi:hypothetical protein
MTHMPMEPEAFAEQVAGLTPQDAARVRDRDGGPA